MAHLLSIDLGTTVCKAAVFTQEGKCLGAKSYEYPLIQPAPNFVEQDANVWWQVAQKAIKATLYIIGKEKTAIKAMSVSSQGLSFVPVDFQGDPLRHAITWLDSRSVAEAAEVREQIGDELLFARTGKRPSPYYMLPKIMWLQRHEPALVRSTNRFLMAHDFLIHRLCGQAVTDYSLAGGSLLLDIEALVWSDQLLDIFKINQAQLPALAWAGTVAGELKSDVAQSLDLPANLPVVVGGQDQKVAALGASISPGLATVSLGTAAAVSDLIPNLEADPDPRIPIFPFVVPGYWVAEGVVSTAGAALAWLRATFFPGQSYDRLTALAEQSQVGSRGVCFYPHFTGATSPLWREEARGQYTGLRLNSSTGDMIRAVMEGVAFQIRANLEVISTRNQIEGLILFGGGARSNCWLDIICQVTKLPVFVAKRVDIANWGACILAGVGTGLFDGYFQNASRLAREILPDREITALYDEIYHRYKLRDYILEPGSIHYEKGKSQ